MIYAFFFITIIRNRLTAKQRYNIGREWYELRVSNSVSYFCRKCLWQNRRMRSCEWMRRQKSIMKRATSWMRINVYVHRANTAHSCVNQLLCNGRKRVCDLPVSNSEKEKRQHEYKQNIRLFFTSTRFSCLTASTYYAIFFHYSISLSCDCLYSCLSILYIIFFSGDWTAILSMNPSSLK